MNRDIIDACKNQDIETRTLLTFISVETGGMGFDIKTGKITIQFEPVWFKKKAPYAPSGLWSVNKVDIQAKEWLAFNDAFSKNIIIHAVMYIVDKSIMLYRCNIFKYISITKLYFTFCCTTYK